MFVVAAEDGLQGDVGGGVGGNIVEACCNASLMVLDVWL